MNHAFAKELLAGFVGAEVDKLAETKGEDWFDKRRAKEDGSRRAEEMYDDHYGRHEHYDPNRPPPQQLQQQFGDQSNW